MSRHLTIMMIIVMTMMINVMMMKPMMIAMKMKTLCCSTILVLESWTLHPYNHHDTLTPYQLVGSETIIRVTVAICNNNLISIINH